MRICRMRRVSEGRRGVAIVIVLGLIAVLMMMAVAFSIHMRIERTGASNYRYGVQARHMVWSGVANAIRDLDGLMDSGSGPEVYPDWLVAASTGGTKKASVLSRTAADFIPASLREAARLEQPYWSYITDDGTTNGIPRGRYAFVIVNSSGLLDANRVGGETRGAGTNCYEIQIDNVPGLTNPTEFLNKANSDGRYETFPELVNVNQRVGDGSSFSVFSLSPMKEQYDIGGPTGDRVYIGEDQSKWDRDKIIAALSSCGIPNPGVAYTNLLDYTDSDSVPRSLSGGSVERVPMINEFDFVYQVTFDAGGGVSGNAGLLIEWVYPFVIGSKETFDMSYDIEITPKAGNTLAGTAPVALSGSFSKNNFTGGNVPPMTYGTADKLTAITANTTNASISVEFDVRVSAYIDGPGGRVDAVPAPYNAANGLQMTVTIPNIARGTTVMATNSWECLDPRFNWVTDGSLPQWFSSTVLAAVPGFQITPGAQNTVASLYFDPSSYGMPNSFDLDDDMYMYVADRPLQSLGELGYICYDWWKTIRLYEHQAVPNPYPEAEKFHSVIDKFTIWSNDYRRGLLNINTTNVDLLASVFYKMPEEEYSTNRLVTWAAAQQIATEIIANRPYTNISELGKRQIDWDALTTGPTEICKESGIRNAAGLLTARDNLFTVIIRADSFSSAMGGDSAKGMALATSRAIAEIWRDPIPDEDGNHKSLIRYFRYLED